MGKYILRRLVMMIPVLFGVTFIVFFIMSLTPGDPAAIILGDQASGEAWRSKGSNLVLTGRCLSATRLYGRPAARRPRPFL